jgi:hypothetical protein
VSADGGARLQIDRHQLVPAALGLRRPAIQSSRDRARRISGRSPARPASDDGAVVHQAEGRSTSGQPDDLERTAAPRQRGRQRSGRHTAFRRQRPDCPAGTACRAGGVPGGGARYGIAAKCAASSGCPGVGDSSGAARAVAIARRSIEPRSNEPGSADAGACAARLTRQTTPRLCIAMPQNARCSRPSPGPLAAFTCPHTADTPSRNLPHGSCLP